MSRRNLILLFGPMCSGKTTLINNYQKEIPEVFHASMDNIKWFVSDYSTKKYSETGIVNRILFAMNTQAALENLSVIVEGSVGLLMFREKYKELAKKNNMRLIQINIDASYGTIRARFFDRVEDAKKNNTRISIDREQFLKKRFKQYNQLRNKNFPALDSSKLSSKEMLLRFKQIIKRYGKKK